MRQDDDKPTARQQRWEATITTLHDRLDEAANSKTKRRPDDVLTLMRAADELLWLDQHVQTFDLSVDRDRRQLDRDFE